MSPKKILLIDDDPDLRLSIRLPLESAGYKVFEAESVEEGKTRVKELHPDLIVLDVMMETATAGFQLALDLHSPDPDSEFNEVHKTPIIMLTAIHSTTPLRFEPDSDYLPVDTFIEKPVEPEILIKKVQQLVGE